MGSVYFAHLNFTKGSVIVMCSILKLESLLKGLFSKEILHHWGFSIASAIGVVGLFSMHGFAQSESSPSWVSESSLEADNPHVLKPKTKSVAVFKNGMGFFTRHAQATLSDGWCFAEELPPAAFGTLAIYSTSPTETVDVVGAGTGESIHFDGIDASNTTETKLDRLGKLKGMLVELKYRHKNEVRTVNGKLVSLSPEFAVIEEPAQSHAVPIQAIKSLRVLNLPLRIHVVDDQEKPVKTANLGIAYMRKGITWIPEYTLRILDEENAELTLRGTLVNEAEDLVHCDVNFVVGVPHFIHSELLSPLAVGRAIRAIGSSLSVGGVPSQVMSQVMNRAAISNNSITSNSDGLIQFGRNPPEGNDLNDLLSSLPALGNAASGDFTVYTKRDLTVRQGERATVTLFSHKIRYTHQYRWNLPSSLQHELVLRNDTKTPWTTGPCLAISGDSPLSEDLLKYTPVGGMGAFEITSAINVANNISEEEIGRKLKAHEPSSNQFLDLVTLRGTIKLKSFATQNTELSVTAPIRGKPTKSTPKGTVQMNSDQLRLVELSSTVNWQVTLKPGEETILEYEYNRYVPSN